MLEPTLKEILSKTSSCLETSWSKTRRSFEKHGFNIHHILPNSSKKVPQLSHNHGKYLDVKMTYIVSLKMQF